MHNRYHGGWAHDNKRNMQRFCVAYNRSNALDCVMACPRSLAIHSECVHVYGMTYVLQLKKKGKDENENLKKLTRLFNPSVCFITRWKKYFKLHKTIIIGNFMILFSTPAVTANFPGDQKKIFIRTAIYLKKLN